MVNRTFMLSASLTCFLSQMLLFSHSGCSIGRSGLNLTIEEAVFSIREGTSGGYGCFMEEISFCPEGRGCRGTECGDGLGLVRCRIFGEVAVLNYQDPLSLAPSQPPKTYFNCGNTRTGTDGGCNPATYDCGKLQTCKEWCTLGAHLGSGFNEHTRYCTGTHNGVNYKVGSEAWGGFCFPL